jgi:hypothetical protein
MMDTVTYSKSEKERANREQDSVVALSSRFDEFIRGLEVSVKPQRSQDIQASIASFSVTTDSVVATATVVTDGVMSRIVVDWGDGNRDTLNARPGHVVPPGEIDPLPTGTYRFYHWYRRTTCLAVSQAS